MPDQGPGFFAAPRNQRDREDCDEDYHVPHQAGSNRCFLLDPV